MEKTEAVKAPEKTKQTSKQRVLAALENAQKLVEQRKAALEAIEARERARANRTPASTVNKQKFLLGAYIMETRPQLAKSADFQAWLKRDQDRSIFGLAPLKPPIAGNGN
ncbi:MAG: hypothetical protein KAX57_07670 [Rhodoferax sp.]|jgi:Tfp pilus assembly protein PilV|nr:hypothetical protein [Rhodoferax sp.]